jgi:uncharacterized protein (TIGR03083 family)
MDKRAVWAATDQERASLADLLATLHDDEWTVPSLCGDWTVKEVAAHVTLVDIGKMRVTVELIRHGGSLARTGSDTARQLAAELSTAQLVERVRAKVGARGHIIGTTHVDPLVDVLVHGQDIAVPLGRERAMPADAAVVAARRVATMAFWSGKRRMLRGLRLRATDADWAYGEGALVSGPIAVLLLVLTGRRARMNELSGAGLERLAAAAS